MSKHKRTKQVKLTKEEIEKRAIEQPRSSLNWFPGHMTKALRKIKERIKLVDIVLEIRDARSPIATGNDALKEQVGNKSRLIVMNKANLADPNKTKAWEKWFDKQDTPFVFINGLDKKSLTKVVKISREMVKQRLLQANPDNSPRELLKMMIIGLPNTGKSTIINKLSNRDASKVADKPGQTQQQIWVNVNKDLMILDTPGIMPPVVETDEQVLWLSALHAIPERIIDIENTCCYIIEHILRFNPKAFSTHYKYDEGDYNLIETLDNIAKKRGCIRARNQYDYERVYKLVINDFRDGSLGPINLGLPPLS